MPNNKTLPIGTHKVSFQDGEQPITLKTTVYLEAQWPSRAENHSFYIWLPSQEESINVLFRGGESDISPFYIEKPQDIVCNCGIAMKTLIQVFGQRWHEKHVITCPLCHYETLHVGQVSRMCLCCENTGKMKTGPTHAIERSMTDS